MHTEPVPEQRLPTMLERALDDDDAHAPALLEAWAVDSFLTGRASLPDAAGLARVSTDRFRALLASRGVTAEPHLEGELHTPEISVVLPVYNEEANLAEMYARLTDTLAGVSGYELIFVENGSTDRSASIISELQTSDPSVVMLRLSRNFGHQGGLTAGIDHSRGRAVVLIDADLQDPPEVISEMMEKWRAGADVVYAVRQKRKDGSLKRAAYFLFYRILQRFSEIDIPLDAGDFCLMDRAVVDHLRSLPEKSRFLRGLRAWLGYTQTPLYYERAARNAGEPKYRYRHLFKFALDGLVSFSSLPLRLASYSGVLVCLCGVGYLMFAVIAHFFTTGIPQGWTSTVALILLLGGTQLFVLGLLGEYIARIYEETKRRPTYVVRSVSIGGRRKADTMDGNA